VAGAILLSWLTSLRLEILYFAGCARFFEWWRAGEGVILRFERVCPRKSSRFQPLRSREISPEFLDRLLRALRRWKYDILAIDALPERLRRPGARPRRFVCLTFDIGYRDFHDHAWPILKKHDAPVALYIPANFPDQLGELWWPALEDVVARNDRIGLIIGGVEHRLDCRRVHDKRQVFDFLYETIGAMPMAEGSTTIRDLCRRYGVDLQAISSAALMSWPEIATIAADPLLTIGSASVTYPMLSRIDRQASERELRMGRAVVEAAVGRRAPHLAYPFGALGTFGRREIMLAAELGFATAVTAEAGVINAASVELMSLPRIAWDGRRRSLRAMRVLLTGLSLGKRSSSRNDPVSAAADPTST
jgi:peptidoglycan/xylan/chitin deacetylase (PgdA/CDA1 family)